MSKLEHWLSAAAMGIVFLLLVVTCAFARGYADGASFHYRGGCDVERLDQLKAGYFHQVQQ